MGVQVMPAGSPAGDRIDASATISRLIIALLVAAAIFVLAVLLRKLFTGGGGGSVLITQAAELGLSLLAILILGKGRFADYGFCRPRWSDGPRSNSARWLLVGLAALLLGALATLAILLSGAGGLPFAGKLSFPQIILFVWILSSTIEEVFTRGFLQSYLAPWDRRTVKLPWIRVGIPTLVSALFFACMHLIILTSGADLPTVVITLIFTFSVGLLAGHQRARTGSLLPAIGVHMLANIGGVVGGIAYGISYFLINGRPPSMG